ELGVGNAEHGAVLNPGQPHETGFDLGRIDVDPAGDHHVALAVAQEQVAVGIDVANVARGDETVAFDGGAGGRQIVVGEVGRLGQAREDLANLPRWQAVAGV